MTPDHVTDSLPPPEKPITSTAGMTKKVVKGSIWTLAGQVVPLVATLVSTPFVIRLLGSENYAVLILVGLIPNYFTFADFGMGIASTKFASEAHGRGDREGEAAVVRTAAFIAFLSSSAIAVPMIVFAETIVAALNVPEYLLSEASLALRLTTASFVLAVLSNVFNTPQLARLRMDLNAAISASGRVVLAFGTVAVLFLGGGIAGAAAFGLVIALAVLVLHVIVSSRLAGAMFEFSISTNLFKPLGKFGLGLILAGVAVTLLINFEKLLLPKLVSIEALAYYSVAFTFASMANMFGIAMVQSLVPAFAQLATVDKADEYAALFSRAVRLNLIWLPPALAFLFVIGEPFFTIWAGEEFGKFSTGPFYILLGGLLFNLVAYVPYAAITAKGRTDILAKLHWAELAGFPLMAVLLVDRYGIIGAAVSWSIRVIVDGILVIWISKRYANVSFAFKRHFGYLALGTILLSPPMFIAVFYGFSPVLIVTVLAFSALYLGAVWNYLVMNDEKLWIKNLVARFLERSHAV